MKIAPNAEFRDGLFDVVLVEGVSRLTVLTALQRVYRATHLTHPAVRSERASEVRIESPHGASLDLELDGEHAAGQSLVFRVHPGLLDILS
jgi:diacylglycerol kinase family enzyme